MSSTADLPRDTAERATLIHREMLQLTALVIVAVIAFFVTRAVARNNRAVSLRNASTWFSQGEQLANAGRLDEAIAAFRRAMIRNRTNRTYVRALARALAMKGDHDAARTILLTLRESAPEDAEINLELARLAVARGDINESVRFYHDALYAPWAAAQAETRRGVRLELIRFLITHGQSAGARPELLAASADAPDDVAHHVELARLFAEAHDDTDALAQFQRALRLAPDDDVALAGAGQAAFRLGQYPAARRYLQRTVQDDPATRDARELVELVLSRDPLAPRIGSSERRRRLESEFSYAEQRFSQCLGQRGGNLSTPDQVKLQTEVQTLDARLKRPATLDQDTVESGTELIDRLEREVVDRCGPPTVRDQALLLIARSHGTDSR